MRRASKKNSISSQQNRLSGRYSSVAPLPLSEPQPFQRLNASRVTRSEVPVCQPAEVASGRMDQSLQSKMSEKWSRVSAVSPQRYASDLK